MNKCLAIWLMLVVVLPTVAWGQETEPAPLRVIKLHQKLSLMSARPFRDGQTTVPEDLQLRKEQLLELASVREEVTLFMQDRLRVPSQDLEAQQKEAATFLNGIENRLTAILDEKQVQRLAQLDLQRAGAMALIGQPAVIKKLGLTASQRLRIMDAQADHTAGGAAGFADFGHAAYEILTDQQRATWNEMIGEPLASLRTMSPVVAGPVNPVAKPVVNAAARDRESLTPVSRLQNPVVIAELQLTEEQLTKLAESYSKYNELARQRTMDGRLIRGELIAEINKARQAYQTLFTQTLTETQRTRLREIQFQSQGERVLLQREFREAAKLTDEQIESLERLMVARLKDPASPSANSTVAANQASAQYRQETLQQAFKLLSDRQREVWDRMAGKIVPIEGLYDTTADRKE